jgi:hypothetical protein
MKSTSAIKIRLKFAARRNLGLWECQAEIGEGLSCIAPWSIETLIAIMKTWIPPGMTIVSYVSGRGATFVTAMSVSFVNTSMVITRIRPKPRSSTCVLTSALTIKIIHILPRWVHASGVRHVEPMAVFTHNFKTFDWSVRPLRRNPPEAKGRWSQY